MRRKTTARCAASAAPSTTRSISRRNARGLPTLHRAGSGLSPMGWQLGTRIDRVRRAAPLYDAALLRRRHHVDGPRCGRRRGAIGADTARAIADRPLTAVAARCTAQCVHGEPGPIGEAAVNAEPAAGAGFLPLAAGGIGRPRRAGQGRRTPSNDDTLLGLLLSAHRQPHSGRRLAPPPRRHRWTR
ncbi:hypothetical protein M8494_19990 [Serratia ureilytica]